MKITHIAFIACAVLGMLSVVADLKAAEPDPLQMEFHRMGVRRHVFTQEIAVGGLYPGEIFGFKRTNPVFETQGVRACDYDLKNDSLVIGSPQGGEGDSSLWVSGMNPYGDYIAEVRELPAGAELRMEFGTITQSFEGKPVAPVSPTRIAAVISPSAPSFLTVRVIKDGLVVREHTFPKEKKVAAPFDLHVQLYGENLGVFAMKDHELVYLGSMSAKEPFSDVIDFRRRATMAKTVFTLGARVPAGQRIVLGQVRSALSSGIGQADIRLISYENGEPYIENNRLWFTFSCRGLGLGDSTQGVMSIDPSVFDPRFEGVIVFDRGDGLLRNDYASHVFYDRKAGDWKAITACFSGPNRGPTGVAVATSKHDPRRGFSVMVSQQLKADSLQGKFEDPSLLWDQEAGKWRMLACAFTKAGFRTTLFESDNWSGPYKQIAAVEDHDSTGMCITKIGSKRYVFSGAGVYPDGSKPGGVLAYTYPELKYLGVMKSDLGANLLGGRVWPNIIPLPEGYPARYVAVQMDRMSVPDISKSNWSYGALYLFWADVPQISGTPYEYPQLSR